MSGILAGLPPETVILYIDDVSVGGTTFESMLDKIEGLLKVRRSAGMTFNPDKCHWARKEAKYLGSRYRKRE